MPVTMKHTAGLGETFQIYLPRGKDRAGNRYGDPGKVNRAWIDTHANRQPAGH